MQHKKEQLESSLQRAIGQIVAEGLSDPRIRGMITITAVKVNTDNNEAIVGVSVLPEQHQNATLAGLNHAVVYFQTELREKIRVRRVPKLRFELDDSLKKQAQLLNEIRKAVDEDQSRAENTNPDSIDEAEGSNP